MTSQPDETPAPAAGAAEKIRAEAVVALHLLALRRQFGAIRAIFGQHPPHRAREALWIGLEVVLAELRGERISLHDLVARADGIPSAPTLSRVVAKMERGGLLMTAPAPNRRRKQLRPTAHSSRR